MYPETNTLPKQHTPPFMAGYVDLCFLLETLISVAVFITSTTFSKSSGCKLCSVFFIAWIIPLFYYKLFPNVYGSSLRLRVRVGTNWELLPTGMSPHWILLIHTAWRGACLGSGRTAQAKAWALFLVLLAFTVRHASLNSTYPHRLTRCLPGLRAHCSG